MREFKLDRNRKSNEKLTFWQRFWTLCKIPASRSNVPQHMSEYSQDLKERERKTLFDKVGFKRRF